MPMDDDGVLQWLNFACSKIDEWNALVESVVGNMDCQSGMCKFANDHHGMRTAGPCTCQIPRSGLTKIKHVLQDIRKTKRMLDDMS